MPNFIPKIIHQIWLGSDLPERYAKFREGLAKDNPGWEMVLWGYDSPGIDKWLHPHHNKSKSGKGSLTNAVRLEAIRAIGGVYLDVDMESIQPLDTIITEEGLDGKTAFCCWEVPGLQINNAAFGATSGHPWVETLLAQINQFTFQPRAWGPRHMTCYTEGRTDVKVFDKPVFFPYCWWSDPKRVGPTPETVLYHHGDESWNERKRKALIPPFKPIAPPATSPA